LVSWSVGLSVGPSVGRTVGWSVGQSVGQSVCWSVGWSVGRPPPPHCRCASLCTAAAADAALPPSWPPPPPSWPLPPRLQAGIIISCLFFLFWPVIQSLVREWFFSHDSTNFQTPNFHLTKKCHTYNPVYDLGTYNYPKPGGTVDYPAQPGLTWRNHRLPSLTRINSFVCL
jgi:hypothetical protein